MVTKLIVLLQLIAIINAVVHTGPMLFGKPTHRFRELQLGGGDGARTEDQYMTYSTIVQRVDHFDDNNKAVWNQRFQYNRKFRQDQNGATVAFLMIGGEGSISGNGDKWVRDESVTMMQWAAQYKAAAFQVEHRFYGPKENSPYPIQTTKELAYLTIDQALADINEFINQMNSMYFNGTRPLWVTFGGSYPGSLSAWFRETYPLQTIAAVSTSSAVHVWVDYYGYAINTEATYRTVSFDCAENIRDGFNQMMRLAYSGADGRKQLKGIFNLCDDFDENAVTKSVQFFFANIYGFFQGINQYTGDNRNNATEYGLGVPNACVIMNDNVTYNSTMDRIQAVVDFYYSFNDPGTENNCTPNNYTDYITYYQDTSYSNVDDVVSMRSWSWQTCTELGYFQTTDGGNNGIFGSTVPIDFYVDQCIALFGKDFTLDYTYKSVEAVKQMYGGAANYRGTKVVFPNGSFDPWQSLGLLEANANADNDVHAFLINGTAHCADMYPPSANDSSSLIEARNRMNGYLNTWISDAMANGSSFTLSMMPILVVLLLL